jgi:hypothetical protein
MNEEKFSEDSLNDFQTSTIIKFSVKVCKGLFFATSNAPNKKFGTSYAFKREVLNRQSAQP